MNDETPATNLPAALPLTLFAACLAVTPLLVSGKQATLGVLACAILSLFAPSSRRVTLLLLCCALGLYTGTRHAHTTERDSRILAALSEEQFVQIEAPLTREWQSRNESFLLRAASFRLTQPISRAIDQPLLIVAAAVPPSFETQSVVRAEGFLRRTERGRYTLHVKSARLISYEGEQHWWDPASWNRRLSRGLAAYAESDRRAVALMQAVALGQSEQLPEETRQDYLRGGIYHLLVFSGMQIAIAAAAMAMILRLAGAAALTDWMLLLLSIIAPRFAGDEPSVARAAWMIGLYAISRLLGRPTSVGNLLFVSALIRLVAFPAELTHPGFALTYGATGGLLLVGKPLATLISNRAGRALAWSAGAELATTQLTLFFFNHYVIGGSVLTLLVGPLITAMLAVSTVALVALWIHPESVPILLRIVSWLDQTTSVASGFFGEQLELCGLAAAPDARLLVACVFMFLLLVSLARRTHLFLRVLLLLLPALVSVLVSQRDASVPHAQLELLDVGQGEAILIRNGEGAVLVDGGGRLNDERFGRNVLVPLLLDRGVRRLDAIALSHPDPDHCGGLSAVIEHLDVGELWLSRRHLDHPCTDSLGEIAEARGTLTLFVDSAKVIRRAGVEFRPIVPRLRFKRSPSNNSSVVYHVMLGERSFLLTGDIEKDAERLLSDEESHRIRADVLKVAHHGSQSSSTSAFLDAVSPRIALISCGRRNRFGHPHPAVVERLSERVPILCSTHASGSLELRIVDRVIHITREIDTSQ